MTAASFILAISSRQCLHRLVVGSRTCDVADPRLLDIRDPLNLVVVEELDAEVPSITSAEDFTDVQPILIIAELKAHCSQTQ
jgi:hypothetical protein